MHVPLHLRHFHYAQPVCLACCWLEIMVLRLSMTVLEPGGGGEQKLVNLWVTGIQWLFVLVASFTVIGRRNTWGGDNNNNNGTSMAALGAI